MRTYFIRANKIKWNDDGDDDDDDDDGDDDETHIHASEGEREIRIDEVPGLSRREHFLDAFQEVGIHCNTRPSINDKPDAVNYYWTICTTTDLYSAVHNILYHRQSPSFHPPPLPVYITTDCGKWLRRFFLAVFFSQPSHIPSNRHSMVYR